MLPTPLSIIRMLGLITVLVLTLIDSAQAKRYNHSSGLGFDYPASWQLSVRESFLVLTPTTSAGGKSKEIVLVGSESMAGVSSLTDPAVIQWFDHQMTALLGTASRTGKPESSRAGVTLNYKTQDGKKHRVQYRMLAGLGTYVAHLSATARYRPAVDAIFASLGGKLALDNSLFGTWSRSKSSSTGVSYDQSGGASYVSANASFRYTFDSANKVSFQSGASVYGQGSGSGGTSSVLNQGKNPVEYGTYAANGSRITIIWNDGDSSEIDYSVFPGSGGRPALKLINPDTKKHQYYQRVN